ncbi:hypothetical protein AVEN_35669-1 [Araneus ventricosus]|uniref:Uncharacterized protein n=1 Tax=Araneus ventricosus TaxID=182803 RepID=A0A4Y2GAX5_ARAVE|nr:hypothetical protein AVEN_35669-1 [Araneus ventricosus]
MDVWWKLSNKQDNEERRFIHNYSGELEAQVTGTISPVQISSPNSQQFTSKTAVTALSDLATQTVSKSLKKTVTALSIALSSLAFQLALKTKLQSSYQSISTLLPCDASVVLLVSTTGRDVTWNHQENSGFRPQ